MSNKYRVLIKDTFIFAIGSLGSKVILFLLVPLYTNYLTTEEYGIAELVTSFSQLIVPFTSLMISSALIRFGMMKGERKEDVAVVSFVVLAVSMIATLSLVPLFSLYGPIRPWKWYLCLQVILTNCSEVERTYLKVKDRNKAFAAMSIMQTAILAGTNVLLLTVLHQGVRGYLTANLVANAFCTTLAFFLGDLHVDLRKGRYDDALAKRMIAYSAPLILSSVSWWAIHSSDKIMIEWLVSASALGIYTAATKIPSLINVIIGIFNQAWGISTIKEVEKTADTSFYSSVFKVFTTFLFGACAVIVAVVKPFISVYVGDTFRDAWMFVPLLMVAAVFYSVSAFIGTLYSALQETRRDMWTTVLATFVNIIVNYVCIKAWGTWGAVAGTVSAYLVCSSVRIIDIRKLLDMNIDITYIANTIIICLQAIAVTIQWYSSIISILTISLLMVINHGAVQKMYKWMLRSYQH